jgi:cytochrome c-type biogenesis protein CcmH
VVLGLAVIVSATAGQGTATLDDRVKEVASGLRCPVCQNLSVADSPSRLAREMRSEIADRLQAGVSPDQIRGYFVQRYGEWVLLAPTRRGLNLVPWLVPIAGVLFGLGLWVVVLRRKTPRESGVPSTEERDRIQAELEALEEPG